MSSGYPGLAYLPLNPGVVVTLGFRNPDALPSHLLGCAATSVQMHAHIASCGNRPQCRWMCSWFFKALHLTKETDALAVTGVPC